ncbi:MAG: sugar phosphate isomerase/epimerase family protein [Salinarchaeum sp.]
MTGHLGAAADLRFNQTVREFVAFVSELGLDHVEFKSEYLQASPEAPPPEEIGTILEAAGMSCTLHAPFRDCNLGSFNDKARAAAETMVIDTLNDAATMGAEAVVVHGGSVPRRYPDRVRKKAHRNAIRSLKACAAHAATVDVPLCLENQPWSAADERHTASPTALSDTLGRIAADPAALRITLDIGHAKASGHDWQAFVERFGDRIEVLHLHDNDGEADTHDPIVAYEPICDAVDPSYAVFEMQSLADICACVDGR